MAVTNIAYAGLRAEMGRFQFSIRDLANQIGMDRDTLGRKLARKQPLKLDEAFAIAKVIPANNTIPYLFAEATQSEQSKK